MGAGSVKAGVLGAGADAPVESGTIAPSAPPGYVPLFDIATKSFPRGPDGRLKFVHWVDQAVALALGVFNGAHASDPDLGNRLRTIKRIAPNKLQAEVEDIVRLALKNLLDAGHIEVTQIIADGSIRGRTLTAVHYLNLRNFGKPTIFETKG